jgi:hypothetical protein
MGYFEVLSQHLPGGNEKNQKIFIQESLSLDLDLSLGPSQYKAGVPTTASQSQHSMTRT